MPSAMPDSLPPVTDLLEDWARDQIATRDGGLGYSSRSALVGFTDPRASQRPASIVPNAAVEGYGTEERALVVMTGNAIKQLPPRAQQQIHLRYLAKPRVNQSAQAKLFKVDRSTVCRWWREIREDIKVSIIAHLVRNG